MTHKDAKILIDAIKKTKMYKYLAHQMKDIEVKVDSKMVLFSNEAKKLEALYRKSQEMVDRQFSKVVKA